MVRISPLLTERLARQGLVERGCASAAAVASLTCAVQAQDPAAARLGIRARSASVTEADVRREVEDDRTVARTWLMRGTIHLVDTRDLRWLTRLIGPSIQRQHGARWRGLGLTQDLLDRCVEVLPDALAAGPLTRRELRDAVAGRGVDLGAQDREAHTHALIHASTVGLVCRAHDRGRDATFALRSDWVPDAPAGPAGDAALAEIARRYFAAYSPATAADFTSWSGLPAGHAIALIRDELTPTDVDGRPGFRLGDIEPVRGTRLLPAFDNYLLGYRDRDAILRADRQDRVYQGGMIRPTVLVDGRVAGSWALKRAAKVATVTVAPFEQLTRAATRAVEKEVADLERFLDRPVTLAIGDAG